VAEPSSDACLVTAPTLPRVLPFDFGIESSFLSDVPGKFPCALNGHGLMIDDQAQSGWEHQGIQQIRTQADASTSPSEASLNPQGLWRRAQGSWHRGAGQDWRDRTDFDEFRFRASKGIDVWTPYEMSLLPATDQKKSGASTNYRLAVAGSRLYLTDGTALYYTTDITVDSPTWTAVTSFSVTGLDLCSDGFTVYVTDGSNIFTTNTGTGAASSTNTLDATHVGFVKGRLMASKDNKLWNITTVGTDPVASPIFTHFNTDFEFVGFAQGHSAIYTAGFSGDKSQIYKIPIKDDGSGLDVPSEAGEIPDGEVVTAIGDYLGFILIGTTSGIRFCEADQAGNLTIGPLIDIGHSVLSFEGFERYIWFSWTNYDATSTGLGRLDLTQFTEDIVTGGRTPAYASDLMATGQGSVLSVVSFQGKRVFTVSGLGVYAEDTALAATGTITSGAVTYGIPDTKVSVEIDVSTQPLDGSYSASIAYDDEAATVVGAQTLEDSTSATFPTSFTPAVTFEITLTLTRDTSPTTAGPVITRWTLKASPGANDGPAEFLMMPFLLHDQLMLPSGQVVKCDVKRERDHIKELRRSRQVVTFQDLDQDYQVVVENYQWMPVGLRYDIKTGAFRDPDGTMLTQLKRLN
jgi:hypothetical protein